MTTITRCTRSTAAGPGNELHRSSIFVTLISELTFKRRRRRVSKACNWLTASAGPHGKHREPEALCGSVKARWITCCLFLCWWEKSEEEETKSTRNILLCSVCLFSFRIIHVGTESVTPDGFDPEFYLLDYQCCLPFQLFLLSVWILGCLFCSSSSLHPSRPEGSMLYKAVQFHSSYVH